MTMHTWCVSGSSPRMRGARRGGHAARHCAGIIPAYAGSTARSEYPCARGRDHPRVCGEHVVKVDNTKLVGEDHPRVCGEHMANPENLIGHEGSSPRMRGARLAAGPSALAPGIIPAYAGSTVPQAGPRDARRDHPRVCGEHLRLTLMRPFSTGSSPRMRGAQIECMQMASGTGIIPAYAGSTLHEVHRSDSKAQFLYGCQGSANQ